jgi:hypothetical protein
MFIYSLPLLFTSIGGVTELDLLLIAIGLLIILFCLSFFSEKDKQKKSLDNYLLLAWLGEVDLKWVFYPFFVILNIGLYAVDTSAKLGIFTVSAWDDIHLIFFLPTVWWSISTWRCSKNTKSNIGAACGRFLTLCVFFEYGLKLLIRIDYPRVFFECNELLLDYGSCF